MQLSCFLITFGIASVLAIGEADYKKQVVYTNAAIELAYNKNDLNVGDNSEANGLEYVIEKMVKDEIRAYHKCFAKINFMIAVPDKTGLINHIPEIRNVHPMQKCIRYQNIMLQEIKNTLHITVPEVDESQDFGSLDLTILADQRRSHVKSALKNIFRRALEFKGLKLAALAEKRRVTGTSLENIMERHVLETRTPVLVEDNDGYVYDVSVLRICRYISLYMSSRFPSSYVEELKVHPIHSTCTLDGDTRREYKKIKGVWWEINPDTDSTVQQLEEQIV